MPIWVNLFQDKQVYANARCLKIIWISEILCIKQAVGGRAHRSLHLQCPFEFSRPLILNRIRSHPGRKDNALCSAKQWHANMKRLQCSNTHPMPNLRFSPVNAQRKRMCASVVQLCISVMFQNQPNKLFEVVVDARRIRRWIHVMYIYIYVWHIYIYLWIWTCLC